MTPSKIVIIARAQSFGVGRICDAAATRADSSNWQEGRWERRSWARSRPPWSSPKQLESYMVDNGADITTISLDTLDLTRASHCRRRRHRLTHTEATALTPTWSALFDSAGRLQASSPLPMSSPSWMCATIQSGFAVRLVD